MLSIPHTHCFESQGPWAYLWPQEQPLARLFRTSLCQVWEQTLKLTKDLRTILRTPLQQTISASLMTLCIFPVLKGNPSGPHFDLCFHPLVEDRRQKVKEPRRNSASYGTEPGTVADRLRTVQTQKERFRKSNLVRMTFRAKDASRRQTRQQTNDHTRSGFWLPW